MTNNKANTIIDVYKTLIDLKENEELPDLQFNWDEKNNTLDIHTVPKQSIKFIKLDLIITPTGVEFK